MDPQTQRALNAINQRFYEREAASFSDTRSHPWPGWDALLARLRSLETFARKARPAVLDVGCGNGRFFGYLQESWSRPFHYVGCDASSALLSIARERTVAGESCEFVVCDLVEREPDESLPPGSFDLTALFGVMHHIPDFARRRALLHALAERMAPGGILALTFWQFGAQARFDKRIVPWPDYNAASQEPVALDQLEPGDHLLRGGADAAPPRYCHFVDGEERSRLLEDLPLELLDQYSADGKSQDLNDYTLLRRPVL